ncbi:MAG: hypothetical protein FWC87_03420 [Acidimicrobiaceae bacterium]|nr:hypothetical protein [Acidimicrobiaceae bacterium]
MSAGLPGLGLSGLFILLSALGSPIVELIRRRRRAGQTPVRRLFVLSVVMVFAVVGIWYAILPLIREFGRHSFHSSGGISTPVASIPVIVVSLFIILVIVAAAELALHVVTPRPTPTPPPVPFRGVQRDIRHFDRTLPQGLHFRTPGTNGSGSVESAQTSPQRHPVSGQV